MQQPYDLQLLLSNIEIDNLPEEIDFGSPVGQEIFYDTDGRNKL